MVAAIISCYSVTCYFMLRPLVHKGKFSRHGDCQWPGMVIVSMDFYASTFGWLSFIFHFMTLAAYGVGIGVAIRWAVFLSSHALAKWLFFLLIYLVLFASLGLMRTWTTSYRPGRLRPTGNFVVSFEPQAPLVACVPGYCCTKPCQDEKELKFTVIEEHAASANVTNPVFGETRVQLGTESLDTSPPQVPPMTREAELRLEAETTASALDIESNERSAPSIQLAER